MAQSERIFEVEDICVKKGKYWLSLKSQKGEKLTLQIDSFEELEKWHLGHSLTIAVTKVTHQSTLV